MNADPLSSHAETGPDGRPLRSEANDRVVDRAFRRPPVRPSTLRTTATSLPLTLHQGSMCAAVKQEARRRCPVESKRAALGGGALPVDKRTATKAINGDVELHYEITGREEGPLVILVAGLGEQIGAVEFPIEHAERFARAGFCVARLDNRDAGLSSSLDRAGRPALDPLFTAMFAGEPIPVP